MKPFVVLLIVFGIACMVNYFTGNTINLHASGCIAMAVMLLFTAMAHFKFLEGMAMMLPPAIPFRKGMVLITGGIEIAAAIGLMIASMRYITAAWLIVFFIVMLPANVYAAIKKVDYEKATFNGNGINYLWFRIPLQVLFIAWIWYFGIYLNPLT